MRCYLHYKLHNDQLHFEIQPRRHNQRAVRENYYAEYLRHIVAKAYSISYQCTSGSLIANQMFVRVPGLLKSSKYYLSPWPIPMIRYKRKLFRVRTKLFVTKRFTPTDDLSLRDNDKTWNKCVWL